MSNRKGYIHGYVETKVRKTVDQIEFDNTLESFIDRLPIVTEQEVKSTQKTGNVAGSLQIDELHVVTATTSDGTPIGVVSKNPHGEVLVEVNGISINLANGQSNISTSACYFTDPSGVVVRGENEVNTGDILFWNGSIAGYELATDDEIKIIYAI